MSKTKDPSDLIDELLDIGPTLAGMQVRPITLATFALLEKTRSPFMSNLPPSEIQEFIILACCKFIALQTGTLKDARKLAQSPDALEEAALDIAEGILPKDAKTLFQDIQYLIQEAMGSQVEPVIPEDHKKLSEEDLPGKA